MTHTLSVTASREIGRDSSPKGGAKAETKNREALYHLIRHGLA